VPKQWERSREQKLSYLRRSPDKTELYRITYHNHEQLASEWEQRFQQQYGGFRTVVKGTLEKYLSCGILAHGAARASCPDCNHSKLIAFSCKCRGFCPSCGTKRALIFAETLDKSILKAVPHRHCVFAIPKRLRVYFKYNRKLHKILFTSAWDSIKQMYVEIFPESTPATVLTIQTSGDALNHNPHLHGILATGVFNQDGNFYELTLDTDKLQVLFQHKVLKALQELELISEHTTEQILSWKHSGFNVWLGEAIQPEDNSARLFISSYIDRNPIQNDKIKISHDTISYEHDSTHLAKADFDPLEFLAALSVHIPNKYEQTIRYYGFYSARTRGKRRKSANDDKTIILDKTDKPKSINRSWAALIKRIYEVDPLICEKCGGIMKIISFITDWNEIQKIIKHLKLPNFHPPPEIKSPSLDQDFYQNQDLNQNIYPSDFPFAA
jgi:hypothetical protein